MAVELFNTALFDDAACVAAYRCSSGALTTDSKGTNTLTNTNSVGSGTGAFGDAGGAADFSSSNTNKILQLSSNIISNTNGFSLYGWVNPYNINQFGSFFTNGKGNTGGYGLFMTKTGAPGQTGSRLFTLDCNTAWHETSFDFTAGAWTQIVLTNDGSTTKIYANANQVYSGTPASFSTPSTAFAIGGDIGAAAENFISALCDDIYIFSRVLTPTEITQSYNGTLPGRKSAFFQFFQ